MIYTLGNKCAKNLCKRTVLLQLIIKNVVICFLEHSVHAYLLSFPRHNDCWSRPTVGRHGRLAEKTAIGDDSEAARASHTTTNDRRPAPRVWNDLPADIVSAPSLAIFKQRLKTHLFGQSFG